MYIYDNVVILSSMWYVLRFEHAHGLKRYNDWRMTRGQTIDPYRKTHQNPLRFVYDYAKGNFEDLRTALSAINLFSIIANDDINTDRHQWKDTFLVLSGLWLYTDQEA